MRELGRRGGLAKPNTKLRQAVAFEEDLREQAREILAKALRGEPVEKAALDSARSLYAFRPTEAPRGREGPELQHPGRGVFSIQQLVEAAAEVQLFSQSGWLDAATEQEMVEKVKATQAKARAEQMENTGSGAPIPQMRSRTLREAHLSPSRRRPGKPLDGGRESAAGRRLRPNGNNGPAAGGGLTAGR